MRPFHRRIFVCRDAIEINLRNGEPEPVLIVHLMDDQTVLKTAKGFDAEWSGDSECVYDRFSCRVWLQTESEVRLKTADGIIVI